MKKVLALAGIVTIIGLTGCTALTSSKDASDTAQIHDVRMRMRNGYLTDVRPTNYGTRAVMEEQHPELSAPANTNTTVKSEKVANPTAGNTTMSTMPDAAARTQPDPTAGN